MSTPDLVAEHAELVKEQAELRQLCVAEWSIMNHQAARYRQSRLWEIRDRLIEIERSAQWKRSEEYELDLDDLLSLP